MLGLSYTLTGNAAQLCASLAFYTPGEVFTCVVATRRVSMAVAAGDSLPGNSKTMSDKSPLRGAGKRLLWIQQLGIV